MEVSMTVSRIINEKGRDVTTASSDASLAAIAATLAQKKIGAVLVMDGDAIGGIISERDIVRAVARQGGEALSTPAKEWMTADVITCTLEDTINEVMQKMTSGRFRHLPVVEDGKLAGIISIGDVVKRRIEDVEREAEQIREYIATA
jgi:CBS domain-containing protein